MRLEDTAHRHADAGDQAARQDRYGHLLGWGAAYARTQATRAQSAVRRAHRRGANKPAWNRRRRDVHADAAAEALISAIFYGWLADRLERDHARPGATIGHRFTLKELAELEDRARDQAPHHLDRILHPRRTNDAAQNGPA